MRYLVPAILIAAGIALLWIATARGCDTPRPADCRVYEDTHTCISRLDERRREIGNAVARALTNLE